MRTYVLFSLSALIVFSSWCCHAGKHQQEDQAALDAEQLQIAELQQTIAEALDTLIQKRNALSVQGRALTADEQAFIQAVYRVEADLHEVTLSGQEKPTAPQGQPPGRLEFLQQLKQEVDTLLKRY